MLGLVVVALVITGVVTAVASRSTVFRRSILMGGIGGWWIGALVQHHWAPRIFDLGDYWVVLLLGALVGSFVGTVIASAPQSLAEKAVRRGNSCVIGLWAASALLGVLAIAIRITGYGGATNNTLDAVLFITSTVVLLTYRHIYKRRWAFVDQSRIFGAVIGALLVIISLQIGSLATSGFAFSLVVTATSWALRIPVLAVAVWVYLSFDRPASRP